MSTAQTAPLEIFLNGAEEQKVELAKLQWEQELLKYTLAAQDKFETIRGAYDVVDPVLRLRAPNLW